MNKKIIILNIIVIVAIFMLGIQVNATDTTFKLQIKESKGSVNYGEEVSFTISIAELQKGEAVGTNAITAQIEYDSSILQYENYTMNNKWSMASLNENSMTFAITNGEYITENQDIITFKFKAKTNINATNTTVSLKNISAAFRMSKEDVTKTSTIKSTDVTKNIKLSQKQSENENTVVDQNTIQNQNTVVDQNTVVNENTTSDQNIIKDENSVKNENVNNSSIGTTNNNSQNNTTISKTSSDASAAGKTLPKTGVKNIILIVVFIVIIAGAIIIVSYNKYEKRKP